MKEIIELEKIARQLDPEENERTRIRGTANAYAEEFLQQLSGSPGYATGVI